MGSGADSLGFTGSATHRTSISISIKKLPLDSHPPQATLPGLRRINASSFINIKL